MTPLSSITRGRVAGTTSGWASLQDSVRACSVTTARVRSRRGSPGSAVGNPLATQRIITTAVARAETAGASHLAPQEGRGASASSARRSEARKRGEAG